VNGVTAGVTDIRLNEKLALGVIVVLIVVIGVYPKPVLELTKATADFILTKMNYKL
jgi:NADH-quinone oxidoreductase subunit M